MINPWVDLQSRAIELEYFMAALQPNLKSKGISLIFQWVELGILQSTTWADYVSHMKRLEPGLHSEVVVTCYGEASKEWKSFRDLASSIGAYAIVL